MHTLKEVVDGLRAHENVDAVFLTGSVANKTNTLNSDIDLVIILRKRDHDLRSLYTWIDTTFADIFFFDGSDIYRIRTSATLSENDLDAIFVDWLSRGEILFDKTGETTHLQSQCSDLRKKVCISEQSKNQYWQKINYNYIANRRYYESNDTIYHEALQVRLCYSVVELFTGYFEFREVAWRGEKRAIQYLKQHDPEFYSAFVRYSQASTLDEKFEHYKKLFQLVFTGRWRRWEVGDEIARGTDFTHDIDAELIEYWQELIGKKPPETTVLYKTS